MIDISAFGTGVTIVALGSFPMGFSVSKFADDQDALTCEEIETSAWEMLYDGSIYTYDKASPILITVSVIPGSEDDINLKILLQSRKGANKIIPLPDITSMVIKYPDGGVVIFSNGTIWKGPLADTVQSAGRKKGNTYSFVFGSFAGAQTAFEAVAGAAQALIGIL